MTRVGVVGAAGRMGREACRAIAADPDLQLVACVDPHHVGQTIEGISVSGDLAALADAGAEVAVDFTHPGAVMDTLRWGIANRVHCVVGTTGISQGDVDELARLVDGSGTNVLIAPNFSIGAVLMMRFAEQAARFLPAAEVIELHHEGKADAPSGTALATARRIAAVRGGVAHGSGSR